MPGEMPQMVTERPNAGAVRHYDRSNAVSNNGNKASTPRTADDTAPILVPNGAGIWTFGDHLRHLAGHAGTIPLARDEAGRTTDYAFGVKKPRRRQMRQRPASSCARGIVPACPARCLRWSPNVQMPAPSGTKIGSVLSAVRGVEALFPLLLTALLRSTSLPSLRNIRTEFGSINHTHCGHARAV